MEEVRGVGETEKETESALVTVRELAMGVVSLPGHRMIVAPLILLVQQIVSIS